MYILVLYLALFRSASRKTYKRRHHRQVHRVFLSEKMSVWNFRSHQANITKPLICRILVTASENDRCTSTLMSLGEKYNASYPNIAAQDLECLLWFSVLAYFYIITLSASDNLLANLLLHNCNNNRYMPPTRQVVPRS